jgi:hypothetical protein
MKNPYEECPQFDRCSCNVCPLDPKINDKFTLENEEECRASKPTRQRIALKYPDLLPYQGLTKKSWDRKKRWEALSPEKKDKFINAGLKNAFPFKKDQIKATFPTLPEIK